MSFWQGLFANLGVICLAVSVWSYLDAWLDRRTARLRTLVESLIAAATVLGTMALSFRIGPDILVDLRSSVIALSGFVAGPVAGGIAALTAAGMRIAIGGGGTAAALVGITLAFVVGAIGHRLLAGNVPEERSTFLLAAATALANLLILGFLPPELRDLIGIERFAAASVLVFVATMVGGLSTVAHLRERQIARMNHLYRAIIETLPDALNAKDTRGAFVAANPATAELMHAGTPENVVGKTVFDFYPPETSARVQLDDERVMAKGEPMLIEQRIDRADGSTVFLETVKAPLRGPDGTLLGIVTHNRDVTAQKRLEADHREVEERLHLALSNMADALVMFDREGRILFCNDQYRQAFPKTAHLRVAGTPLATILRASVESGEEIGVAPEGIDAWIAQVLADLQVPSDHEIALADGRFLHVRTRPISNGSALSVLSDITASRQAERALALLNERLVATARTDALTGLVNRRGFDETLSGEIARIGRSGSTVGLLLIDVDHFKAFNDTYGHQAGDRCLAMSAACLKGALRRQTDVAARYGGEEFAAILPDVTEEGAVQVAEAMRVAVASAAMEHAAASRGIVTVSIGAALMAAREAGQVEDPGAQLVARADAALYRAKAAGRNAVVFEPAPDVSAAETSPEVRPEALRARS